MGDYGVSFADGLSHLVTYSTSWSSAVATKQSMLRVESPPEFAGFDAVVFGEVLKHSVNPLELLTDCVEHVRLDCHVELPASAQR